MRLARTAGGGGGRLGPSAPAPGWGGRGEHGRTGVHWELGCAGVPAWTPAAGGWISTSLGCFGEMEKMFQWSPSPRMVPVSAESWSLAPRSTAQPWCLPPHALALSGAAPYLLADGDGTFVEHPASGNINNSQCVLRRTNKELLGSAGIFGVWVVLQYHSTPRCLEVCRESLRARCYSCV